MHLNNYSKKFPLFKKLFYWSAQVASPDANIFVIWTNIVRKVALMKRHTLEPAPSRPGILVLGNNGKYEIVSSSSLSRLKSIDWSTENFVIIVHKFYRNPSSFDCFHDRDEWIMVFLSMFFRAENWVFVEKLPWLNNR